VVRFGSFEFKLARRPYELVVNLKTRRQVHCDDVSKQNVWGNCKSACRATGVHRAHSLQHSEPTTGRPRNYHARSGSGHDEAIQRAPWYGGGLHVCSHVSAREWIARRPGEPLKLECIRMTNPTHTQRPHPFSCLHMPSFATLGTHPYSRDALISSAQQYVGWFTCLRRCAAVRGM
jgi:hypothetical protein